MKNSHFAEERKVLTARPAESQQPGAEINCFIATISTNIFKIINIEERGLTSWGNVQLITPMGTF
ncbi:hypothetical protein [Pseudalkalibacillus hwajinpoensis]|uniref:hypothetical protein n=1 Tax=Guptibacillus hwajinpoensis TaxID=208199 RepID=UPI00146D1A5D|nr:hypothetical protein [Pseudalkalibacillus hwajinpoensis]